MRTSLLCLFSPLLLAACDGVLDLGGGTAHDAPGDASADAAGGQPDATTPANDAAGGADAGSGDAGTDSGGGSDASGQKDAAGALGKWPDSPTRFCVDPNTCPATCPIPGQPGFGQDGSYYPDSTPIYTASNGTVADAITGLVWQDPVASGGLLSDAVAYCAGLSLGGMTGWRLPSRLELVTIQDYGRDRATPVPGFDPTGSWLSVWSSSPYLPEAQKQWVVGDDGQPFPEPIPAMGDNVRCVHGAPLGPSIFVVTSADSVRDEQTGLVWQRNGTQAPVTWFDALAACEALDLDGASNWRLPSVKELQTIVDETRTSPAIDPSAFPGTSSAPYWSSTPKSASGYCNYSLTVDFATGRVAEGFNGSGSKFPPFPTASYRCVH